MSAGLYVAAFRARCEVGGQVAFAAPGIVGRPNARLLVTDDRAYDRLAEVGAGVVTVFAGAARCTELLSGRPGWRGHASTALVRGDLLDIPAAPLPAELQLRRVADDGVPLVDAAAAAMRADPGIDGPPERFAGYLRSLAATYLFAATDGDGVIRATSGCRAFGAAASVMFVNTDPGWRGRGIGRAMTALALRAARDRGARHAALDSTEAGLRLYQRLGFATVSPVTRFVAPPRR